MKTRDFKTLALILVALATILIGSELRGTATLSSMTAVTGMGKGVTSYYQTNTGGFTTSSIIFGPMSVSAYKSWSLWIYNTGTANLNDLDILISNENANWDKALDLVGLTFPFLSDVTSGCTTTLNAATKCVVTWELAPPIGWIEVKAAAAATAETKVQFIGRTL